MKKYLLTMLIALMGCMAAMAGNPLKVSEGSLKGLKKESGKIFVTLNFDGAKWDGKKELRSHYPNLDELVKMAFPEFEEEFNDECKNFNVTSTEADAKYVVTVKIDNMDSYYRAFTWGMPGHETKMWGKITIVDRESGETVAVLTIDELDGGGNPSVDRSFVDAFDKLGSELASRFNKGK